MNLGIEGKRALVFGGTRGIGSAVARMLVLEGARVAISGRDEPRLRAAQQGTGADLAILHDFGQPGAARAAVEEVTRAWAGLDILVTNTGGLPTNTLAAAAADLWRGAFEGLWTSAVEALGAAIPGMQARRWGRVLLVTTAAAREPAAGLTNGLRAGLLGVMRSVAPEVARDGVTVNALIPGLIRTERTADLGLADALVAGQIPARRMGEPDEFAAAAAFLASALAGYITGQALAVDGGWMIAP